MNISRKRGLGHFETALDQPAAQLILAANRRACDEFSDGRMPILLHNVLTTLSQLLHQSQSAAQGRALGVHKNTLACINIQRVIVNDWMPFFN